jgi:hypothetical protein
MVCSRLTSTLTLCWAWLCLGWIAIAQHSAFGPQSKNSETGRSSTATLSVALGRAVTQLHAHLEDPQMSTQRSFGSPGCYF